MIGLGTWKSKEGEVGDAVYRAVCHEGYRHVDAAQIYGNQVQVGEAIARAMQDCGLSRKDLWVTSKVWTVDFGAQDVGPAVDRMLQELKLEYLDQVLLHWPVAHDKPPRGCPPICPERWAGTDDPMRPRGSDGQLVAGDAHLANTWQVLEAAQRAGKVRSIGVSNFNAQEIEELAGGRVNAVMPAVNQVEIHVGWNQEALLHEMQALGVQLVAYTPLGNPGLYGDQSGLGSPLVAEIAKDSGLSPAQVMINFLLSRGIVALPKSVTPSRLGENINFDLTLTDAHIQSLLRKAPQSRLANPRIRPGGAAVFTDPLPNAAANAAEL